MITENSVAEKIVQATNRDLRCQRHEKTNAWVCARPTTDHDPASVIPDKKRKSETVVILCGHIVFGINNRCN